MSETSPLTSYLVDENGVALIRLERPKARNAINTQMLVEMLEHLALARADDAVRVLVISAADPLNLTGILLTILATAIYLRFRHLPLLDTLDAWSPAATLAWAFLALGHFAEGSDAGLPTALPWGMAIPPSATRLPSAPRRWP